MASVTLSEEQARLIDEIAQNEKLSNYKVVAKSGSMKGDGYLGIITSVLILDDQNRKLLDLVLKSAQTQPEFRKQAPIRAAYLREIFIYKKVFTELLAFEKERQHSTPFTSYAKFFGSSDLDENECLVLENLKDVGFKLWNRMVPMNHDHVALVFEQYGKFHAVSLAMKDQQPKRYEALTSNMQNIFQDFMKEDSLKAMLKIQYDNGLKAVENNPRCYEALKKFSEKASSFLMNELKELDRFSVITHGDCWCNNLLFKYDDVDNPKKPTNVRLLDWQISSVGSVVLDLSYFFYVCSPKEVILNYKKYLQIYHESLSKALKNLGSDPETLYPFAELEKQWKKFSKFGMHMGLMVIKVMLSEVDEIPDYANEATAGKNLMESFNFGGANTDLYHKRVEDIVEFMVDNDLL